jgi:hypothetical protein
MTKRLLALIVLVANTSSPTFSVIDQSGNLTLSQDEAIARAVVAG